MTAALTQRAGIGRYTRELVAAIRQLPDAPVLQPFSASKHDDVLSRGAGHISPIDRSVRSWRLEMLARHLIRCPPAGPWDACDVYHAPDIAFPPLRVPVVTTVHDLSYLIYPQFHTRLNRSYLRLMTPMAARRARLIIADSHSTARDVVERVDVPSGKIRVIHPGIAPHFLTRPTDEQIAAVRARYGLTDPFILSVGTVEPRKNLTGTVQAYRILRERLGMAPLLALVGSAGWGTALPQLPTVDVVSAMRRLGYVPDEDLAALYASCSAFLYPSHYEGFGLPVAEALALGAPTVTSRVSSLPEVAGDAALLINPSDPEEIAVALERILTDGEVANRLRRAGPRQAHRFTAKRWAAETVMVYNEAMAG